MKKKLACLLLCAFTVISLLSGCNLFETHTQSYLDQIVASAGSVEITKEQLINGYYNYGSTLINQGYSYEEACDEIIKLLIQREFLLNYVKENAALEQGLSQDEYIYELTNTEYNEAIKSSWQYIDEQLNTLTTEIYGDKSDMFESSEETSEPDFSPKKEYTPTLSVVYNVLTGDYDIKKYVDPIAEENKTPEPEKLDLYEYPMPIFATDKAKTTVWNKYISNLKSSQQDRGHSDMSDTAVFKRELDRVNKINSENAYLTKFENNYTENYGFDKNGYLLDSVKQKILTKYKKTYLENKEEFDIDPESHANGVVAVNSEDSYVYYGNSQNFFHVMHILVLFTDEQTAAIEEVENDPFIEDKESYIAEIKDVDNTYVYARDEEGYKTSTKVTVRELQELLQTMIDESKVEAGINTANYDASRYAQIMATKFNDFIYIYGEDTGMINPSFDYVIGTQSSGMVDSFTERSRDLYNASEKGAVSFKYDEETGETNAWVESTYGYHFILYVDDLTPIVQNVNEISIELLASKTVRLTSSQTYLELYLSKVASSDYSTYETNLIKGLESGLKYTFFKSRYSDLYNN